MNVLEMKGSLVQLIAVESDEAILREMFSAVMNCLRAKPATGDWWDELSAEEQAELEQGYQDSFDEANLVDGQALIKKYRQSFEKNFDEANSVDTNAELEKHFTIDGLTAAQTSILKQAIAESDDDENFVSTEVAFAKYKQWLEK